MAKKNIKDILEKIEAGEYTLEEEQVAKTWLFQLNQNNELHLSDEKLVEVSDKMWSVIEQSQQNKPKEYKTVRLWPRIGIAAAIATILFGAGLFFYKNNQKETAEIIAYQNDVAPGKQGATLTLANGKKIRLSDAADGEIAKEAGIVVTKTADGQLIYEVNGSSDAPNKTNTLTTANGETYILTLPDKSKVWMNAASNLTYSASLVQHGQRRVKLEGEAYFQVTKDKTHPFVVESRGQTVEVLGTHFNVNSYADEAAVATTLLEGSVKVTANGYQQVIKPNEQALSSGNKIKVQTVDIEEIVDWKEGDFYLNKVSLRNAMRKIARWYNVEVIYDAAVPEDLESTGYISRTNKLSAVLQLIEKSGDVHFKIEGKKVYVSK